jgi:hypothetical protein
MVEDWQSIIKQLEAKQKSFKPGDLEILNVASLIQSIEGDLLGGNFGHAEFFQENPEVRERHLTHIRELISRYIPEDASVNKDSSA